MFKILFEDDNMLVIDKPAGMVVTSSQTQNEPALEDLLKEFGKSTAKRSGIVHRLDKDTSGILLVAKNQEILIALQSQFKKRQVKKEYLTLVHGDLQKEITVDAAILRNPADREKFIADDTKKMGEGVGVIGGLGQVPKLAVTRFIPVSHLVMPDEKINQIFVEFNKIQIRKIYASKYPFFTYLKCQPLTGRTHQIRVHLKHIGHTIVGDNKYGGRKVVRVDHRWCKRQFLHAAKLEFLHPVTNKPMVMESALADDLQLALTCLEDKH